MKKLHKSSDTSQITTPNDDFEADVHVAWILTTIQDEVVKNAEDRVSKDS